MEAIEYRSRHNPNEIIVAVQLTKENVREVEAWCNGFAVIEHDAMDSSKQYVALNVPTNLGNTRAHENWYVILFGNIRFFPMRPDAFEDYYQPI